MGTVNGWVLRSWIKMTLLLALIVGAVWLFCRTGSGGFWTSIAVAVVAEWYVVRQLARSGLPSNAGSALRVRRRMVAAPPLS